MLMVHSDQYAGQNSAEKRAAVAEWLTANKLDSTVISALDSVAWLLECTRQGCRRTRRLRLSFVLAHADGTADLFVAPEKSATRSRKHLGNAVRLRTPQEFVPELKAMSGKRIAVDPDRAVAAIFGALQGRAAQHIIEARDPTIVPKASQKPHRTIGPPRRASPRWRRAQSLSCTGCPRKRTRASSPNSPPPPNCAAFREATGMLKDLSFDTISAAGPNGASPHYKVDEKSNRRIDPEQHLSGRQRRAISRRHHRRHPHHLGRPGRADRRNEGPLHPRAQGPYRAGARDLPRRHTKAHNSTRWRARHCGRQASITPTAPATASAASSPSTKARNASANFQAGRPAPTSRCYTPA